MVTLDDTQVRNYSVAFYTADLFAAARGLDLWDVRDVMATMLLTESNGYIYANDGQGFKEPSEGKTSWNQTGTPTSRAQMREILRRSIDPVWLEKNNLHYDRVGSNGRSTGPAQQLSEETGGAWGPMTGTMRVADAVTLFLSAVDWSDRDVEYKGKPMANWQTAMLLRVQQPLPSEVASNYGASQLATAQAIARDPRFTPNGTPIPTPNQGQDGDFIAELLGWKAEV